MPLLTDDRPLSFDRLSLRRWDISFFRTVAESAYQINKQIGYRRITYVIAQCI